MINTEGKFQLCCSAVAQFLQDEKGNDCYVGNISPLAVWNSANIREIRKRMLNGDHIESCKHCYYLESIGVESWREKENSSWLEHDDRLFKRVMSSASNDFFVSELPLLFEIRFGNTCNLGCRMCSPTSSSFLSKEYTHIYSLEQNPIFSEKLYNVNNSWINNERLWDEVNDYSRYIERLGFSGGEPLIIKNNIKILDLVIESGRSHEVDLIITTNLTMYNDTIAEKIKRFRKTYLNLSLDGVGKVQEYLRYPSTWEDIDNNLKRYIDLAKDNENICLNITVVSSGLNLLHWEELLDYFDKRCGGNHQTELLIVPLKDPPFYMIESMPQSVKERGKSVVERCLGHPLVKDNQRLKSFFKSLFAACESQEQYDAKKFDQYNKALDRNRNIDMSDYLPTLASLLKESYVQEK